MLEQGCHAKVLEYFHVAVGMMSNTSYNGHVDVRCQVIAKKLHEGFIPLTWGRADCIS